MVTKSFEKRNEMHEVMAKSILSQQNGMNIYRGCSHGCIIMSPEWMGNNFLSLIFELFISLRS